jgi:hypothetical protein
VLIEGDFMHIDNARTGDVRLEDSVDPRTRLAREKYFTQRPRPLERWLWRQRIPAAAERVFWFHWSEGTRNGDWCSQIALRVVAHQCEVDTSTVTRAYQELKRRGLIQRIDPGRDAANPFAQATCITKVLLPNAFMAEFDSSPNRPSGAPRSRPGAPVATPAADPRPPHPHGHLTLAERRARLKVLAAALSPSERERWDKAICGSARALEFDPETQVPADIRAEILAYLAARETPKEAVATSRPQTPSAAGERRLSVFDVARLRHGLQKLSEIEDRDELARQILWSMEVGALRSFGVAHGINIALKKVREGHWSRPNRMPPNWLRQLSEPARPETCRGA